MAEAEPMIASAIVVPEAVTAVEPSPAPQSPGPGASLKRRQSSTSENDSKRPRLSRDGSTESHAPTPVAAPAKVEGDRREARRKSGQVEERKRGQRLFGALLGTLSQSSSSSAAKRRADIEKRQQAKLKQQAEEDSQRRHERLEDLKAARRRQQVKADEQTMRQRHSNLLLMANFLQTKAEPKIYYKPWELLPEHEVQIKQQIEEAQAIIDEEIEEIARQRRGDETQSEALVSSKTDDETMADAPRTTPLAPQPDSVETKEKKDEEPDVSGLTRRPDQAALDPEPAAQQQDDDPMEGEQASGGAQVETRNGEETTLADVEAMTKTDERADTKSDEQARVEAEMMEHGETVVEAEEDTVIY